MNRPNRTVTTLTGIATAIEWEGKTIVISADDAQTVAAYLKAHQHEGAPPARHVAITLGLLATPPQHPTTEN